MFVIVRFSLALLRGRPTATSVFAIGSRELTRTIVFIIAPNVMLSSSPGVSSFSASTEAIVFSLPRLSRVLLDQFRFLSLRIVLRLIRHLESSNFIVFLTHCSHKHLMGFRLHASGTQAHKPSDDRLGLKYLGALVLRY
jgi:hypothetical protein